MSETSRPHRRTGCGSLLKPTTLEQAEGRKIKWRYVDSQMALTLRCRSLQHLLARLGISTSWLHMRTSGRHQPLREVVEPRGAFLFVKRKNGGAVLWRKRLRPSHGNYGRSQIELQDALPSCLSAVSWSDQSSRYRMAAMANCRITSRCEQARTLCTSRHGAPMALFASPMSEST
jgi:hypothetical protein